MALLRFLRQQQNRQNCKYQSICWAGEAVAFPAIIETVVPSVAFVILLRDHLRGTAIPVDKILLAGYAHSWSRESLQAGWEFFVGVAIMAAAVYVYERRKLPLVAIMIGVPIILFLQPGKEKFRQHYWRPGASESYVERFSFWMDSPGVNGKTC